MKRSSIQIWPQRDEKSERKRKQNRADYLARKSSKTDVLLRLEKADAASFDTACKARGLSRSVLFSKVLLPMLEAQTNGKADVPAATPGDEFDALFMSE